MSQIVFLAVSFIQNRASRGPHTAWGLRPMAIGEAQMSRSQTFTSNADRRSAISNVRSNASIPPRTAPQNSPGLPSNINLAQSSPSLRTVQPSSQWLGAPSRREMKSSKSLPPVDMDRRGRRGSNSETDRRGKRGSFVQPIAVPTGGPAPAPAPAKRKSGWAAAAARPSSLQGMIQDARNDYAAQSKEAYRHALSEAHRAWQVGSLDECERYLAQAYEINPNCETLHRFRATLRSRQYRQDDKRQERLDDALADAGNAVASAPGNPRNHHLLAIASQRKEKLAEAGTAYLTSMTRGIQGTSDQLGYTGYLNTVRRQRHYFADVRPPHRKAAGPLSTLLARTPSRASIFDPHKTLDEGEVAAEDLELPDPPTMFLKKAEINSITVGWRPASGQKSLEISIYAYEMEMAIYDVVWEGNRFFDGYRPFERVHKASASITETTLSGLMAETKVMLRIRAQSYSGFGDWNELVVSTLPPLSKQVDALPLPRKWLQVDVADLVPLHVMEVGGNPKSFFMELASCFEPRVRAIKRLFTGWSRAGLVGQKVRAGELSRGQFSRFVKEVGLGFGGGAMCKRSGAKLLATNDVDRIFQRANIDSRGTENTRGGIGNNAFGIDASKVAELAESALEDLAMQGGVEADAGESELRDKLRPLFDQFDEDGSGSVSTEEIGKMAKALNMEMSPAQLEELMIEADPDGSGEIEFEELVAVLKKQMKDGGGNMAALFKVPQAEDGDGGNASMVLLEFVHALIRMGWECYPDPSTGIGTRLNKLLERAVLPGSAHLIESSDPMEAEMRSKRVQAITEYYSNDLYEVYKPFAAADASLVGQTKAETLSFPELVFMMKQGGMLDANLTVAQMTALFAQVNAQASDDGEKDDDNEELNFSEFKSLVCRIANAKIPESTRGGEPFEYTWQSFLAIIFLPKFRSIIKDMKRGLAKKNI